MATTVLLVATAPGWFGTARMPRPLARAGFNVVLLAPRGSLAEKSRYVSKIQSLDSPVSAQGWLGAFAEIVASAGIPRELSDSSNIRRTCVTRRGMLAHSARHLQ